jgi:hypothetical protein
MFKMTMSKAFIAALSSYRLTDRESYDYRGAAQLNRGQTSRMSNTAAAAPTASRSSWRSTTARCIWPSRSAALWRKVLQIDHKAEYRCDTDALTCKLCAVVIERDSRTTAYQPCSRSVRDLRDNHTDHIQPYEKITAALRKGAEVENVGAAFCRHAYFDSEGHWENIEPLERKTPGVLEN